MFRLLVFFLILGIPFTSFGYTLEECKVACETYFGGTTPTVPPIVVPPATSKVFPHEITFERDSDQGNGSAAILFRTIPEGTVVSVSVNGEAARLGKSYKGASVFLMSKPGDQYARPLAFVIKTSDGNVWTASSGTQSNPSTPAGPVTGYSKSKEFTSYGERNGGRKAWRISGKGPSYGSQIKFVFSSGKEFTVKDTSRNCRDQESCGRNSKAPMYGFVFKPGIGANGEGDNDTGTSHGGIYLHAPYGDKSNTVTLWYNN